MKQFQKAKEIYHSLKIPNRLSDKVEEALEGAKQKKRIQWYKPLIATSASFCIGFVLLLNVSQSFAEAAYQIPIIGDIAKVFTVTQYEAKTDTELVKITMPSIGNTGNTELEKKTNKMIEERINAKIEEIKAEAKEFKARVEEYKDPSVEFRPMELTIDYEIKCSNENTVSFLVKQLEGNGYSFFEQRYAYNIDLKTGKDITLRDILGENYREIANKQINEQIEQIKKEQGEYSFFHEDDDELKEHGGSFQDIDIEQEFYINQKGNPVIVFPKYSIAPGYMGILEFEITK